MTETTRRDESEIVTELKEVGRQMRGILDAAWESEKRRELESEISEGLSSLGAQIEGIAKEIRDSEEAHKLRADIEEIREAARKGELSAVAREELLDVLRSINAELRKLRDAWAGRAAEKKD